ncbi:MAG: hypothetical protein U1F98_13195 [Verrucomicrobiota bacterium]
MGSISISLITFLCLLLGILAGIRLQCLLPDHHLSSDAKDTVKLGAGMVATMSALILGLLVSSSKSAFDGANTAFAQNAARVIQLNDCLKEYGEGSTAVRERLVEGLRARIQDIWSTTNQEHGMRAIEHSNAMVAFDQLLRQLNPTNDVQRIMLARAEQLAFDIRYSRLQVIAQQTQELPGPLLMLMVFWLTLLFLSFGLFAPRNITVFAVLAVCAISVSSAVFLILEMSHPLDGLIKVSSGPLYKALELIQH